MSQYNGYEATYTKEIGTYAFVVTTIKQVDCDLRVSMRGYIKGKANIMTSEYTMDEYVKEISDSLHAKPVESVREALEYAYKDIISDIDIILKRKRDFVLETDETLKYLGFIEE